MRIWRALLHAAAAAALVAAPVAVVAIRAAAGHAAVVEADLGPDNTQKK